MAIVGACIVVSSVPAGAQDNPSAGVDQKVADAQARADRAADAYFDALEHRQKLDKDIASLQDELDQLDGQVARLRKLAAERAVEAYKRSGTPFANTFGDAEQVTEVARRLMLLEAVNERDQNAADAYQEAKADRERHQFELRAAKQDQAATLDQLQAEEERLNELLIQAQDERRALAAQRAAVAAAAAAAPAPTSPSTPAASTPSGSTTPPSSAPGATPVPAPVPPAPGYVPRTGTHPHHDDPFLVCTRQRESGGNYQAYNPAGPFSGAYQFLQSTWNGAANHAGRGDLVGVEPRNASAYDQDDMAWTLYQWRGNGPWNGLC